MKRFSADKDGDGITVFTHQYCINVNIIEPAPLSCRKTGFQRKGWCLIATAAPEKPKNEMDCVKKQQM